MSEPVIFIAEPRLRRDVTTISIVGLGPVGLCSGVAFATQGHRVLGVDIDPKRREQVARGKPPFYEKGIEAALRTVLREKRFSVVETMKEAIGPSAVVFLCVGTPSRPDGSMDDSALREAVKSVAEAWQDGKRRTVVVKSTVLPGTVDGLVRPILEAANVPFRLGMNPEFLREGRALEDALRPDRIVLGADGPETARILKGLYRSAKCPIFSTDVKTAEAVKYATNAFLAQNDVQYLRSIAKLEEELGDLRGKRIALLGLAFKGDTDDVRETRAVPIARTLVSKGAMVVGYDPLAGPAFARLVPEVRIVASVKEALARADGVILQADWPAFSRLTPKDFVTSMATPVVVDGRRILDPKKMRGVRFHRIG